MESICKRDNCDRPVHVPKNGYCASCLTTWYKHGRPDEGLPPKQIRQVRHKRQQIKIPKRDPKPDDQVPKEKGSDRIAREDRAEMLREQRQLARGRPPEEEDFHPVHRPAISFARY